MATKQKTEPTTAPIKEQDIKATHIVIEMQNWVSFVEWAKRNLGPDMLDMMDGKLKAKPTALRS